MAGGRPTKYLESYNEQARKLCLLGYTDDELADFFEVDVSTINNWKIEHPKFFESIKKGKCVADADIAEALYHRAKGYKCDDIHFSAFEGQVTQTPYTKHFPPDTGAAFIWLKNRRPDKWKDRKDEDTSGDKEEQRLFGKD